MSSPTQRTLTVGIDPGNAGAIAVLHEDGSFFQVHDMPLMAMGKKQQVNGAALARIMCQLKNNGRLVVFLERAQSMPGQGVSSMFNYGMGYGVIQGVLSAIEVSWMLVSPAVWKKAANLSGKEKDNARTLAQQLYPSAPLDRKKDIGRADALMIARHGYMQTS